VAFLPQRNELFRSIVFAVSRLVRFFSSSGGANETEEESIILNCCPAALLLHLFYIRIELSAEMLLLQDKPWQFLLLLNALFILFLPLFPQIWCFYGMLLMSKEDKFYRAKAFVLEKRSLSKINSEYPIFTFAFS